MGISVKNMRVITDNNRWVRVNHGSPHKRPGRSLANKCGNDLVKINGNLLKRKVKNRHLCVKIT